ncbi:MAG: phosphoenolpyruvate carboxykinase (ATP) [Candidatus Cloacimonadota bacterium]|nr:MAG: phosphoenolpyruvate carboxykinase (ATP) [Candidatus Cloacimonadota bacterium]
MKFQDKLTKVLQKHSYVLNNLERKGLIKESVHNKEALISKNGALVTWTPIESTGRSPKDTVIVKRQESEANIDWDSPNNIPITQDTFDMISEDALAILSKKEKLYVTDRVLGADSSYALPVRTVTDNALSALFTDNMFRQVPDDIGKSVFANRGFTLIALPYEKLESKKYTGRLRMLPNGKTSDMVVAMDFDRSIGIVYGSAYGGSVKKLMFTVMNYILPAEGILPLHCSANEGPDGNTALLLGLSGTGKTTLSADPRRALLGDDEHGWSNNGIANFENGCYAKLIHLKPEKEPEIYNAITHYADYLEHGAIVENTMMYPTGEFDFDDERLTPNSRGSYPLTFLTNIKKSSTAGHPNTILFLTADANGVLPPVAKLSSSQAMLWFLMGYTSKLAGTETGIVEPVSTFSRFFGEPFMPRNPDVYAKMLGQKMEQHGTQVYLINTGWSGGPYGVSKRIDIDITRAIVNASLTGQLKDVEYEEDRIFHIFIPKYCPDVPTEILYPKNTWSDKNAYEQRARKLAQEFNAHFEKAYGNKNISKSIANQCPGK